MTDSLIDPPAGLPVAPPTLEMFDYWSAQEQSFALSRAYKVRYSPNSAINPNLNRISFSIPISVDFISLMHSYFEVHFKITKPNGSNLDAWAEGDNANPHNTVYPVNNAANSLWSHVDLRINKQLLTNNFSTHAQQQYINTLLSYNKNCQDKLEILGWRKDSNDFALKSAHGDEDRSDPVKVRANWVKQSKVVKLFGKILTGVFTQPRALLNQVEIDVEFVRNTPEFFLTSNAARPDFRIEIKELFLHIQYLELHKTLKDSIEDRLLAGHAANYPVIHGDVRPHVIPAKSRVWERDDLYPSKRVPDVLIVGVVTEKNHLGDYAGSPFHFIPAGLERISVSVNGHELYYEMDYDKDEYQQPFFGLQERNILNNSSVDIDYYQFKRGFCLYVFNFNPPSEFPDEYLGPLKLGSIRLTLTFKATANNETLYCLTYGLFPETIAISPSRQLLRSYQL